MCFMAVLVKSVLNSSDTLAGQCSQTMIYFGSWIANLDNSVACVNIFTLIFWGLLSLAIPTHIYLLPAWKRDLTVMCPSMAFFVFILLRIHWASWICGWMPSIIFFGSPWPVFSNKYIFYLIFSLLLLGLRVYLCKLFYTVPRVLDTLFSFWLYFVLVLLVIHSGKYLLFWLKLSFALLSQLVNPFHSGVLSCSLIFPFVLHYYCSFYLYTEISYVFTLSCMFTAVPFSVVGLESWSDNTQILVIFASVCTACFSSYLWVPALPRPSSSGEWNDSAPLLEWYDIEETHFFWT